MILFFIRLKTIQKKVVQAKNTHLKQKKKTMEKPICVDVGGFHHYTSEATLRKSEKIRELLDSQTVDEEILFIDRDGVSFLHILYYLRTGQVSLIDDEEYIRFLIQDAIFYGLPQMQTNLEGQLKIKSDEKMKDIEYETNVLEMLRSIHVKLGLR